MSGKEEYIPLLREEICQLLLHNITQKIALINHPWHKSLKRKDVSQRQHINKKERQWILRNLKAELLLNEEHI